MNLREMSAEYKEISEKCREKLKVLRARANDPDITETERLILRRNCTLVESMARETRAVSKYLENYYRKEPSNE